MVAPPGVMQAYPGNGGECWSLRCSHWSRAGTPWSVIPYDWSHEGSPWRMKSSHWSPGGSIWSIRCSHWKEMWTHWLAVQDCWLAVKPPPPPTASPLAPTPSPPTPSPPHALSPQKPAGYVMHWRGGVGPETSLRYSFKVTHGLDYFGSQRALAYRLDAISQGRKNSWFQVPNPLKLALIMYLHASKTLCKGPYKS